MLLTFCLFFLCFRVTTNLPASSSAPPATTSARIITNHSFTRISAMNANQQTPSRFKNTYDNRRYMSIQTPYKRLSQPPVNPSQKNISSTSRTDIAPSPSARLVLQQQVSSPGRLQNHHVQSMSTPQFAVPNGSTLDPLVVGRGRTPLLPPPSVRNTIHRNALSLNTLVNHPQNPGMPRGRSQTSAHKGSMSTRQTRIRQQSLAPFDAQQQAVPYASTTVTYRHPLNTDPSPVLFE